MNNAINLLFKKESFFESHVDDPRYDKRLVCISSLKQDFGLSKYFKHIDSLFVNEIYARLHACTSSNQPDAIVFFTDYIDGIFFENLSSIAHTIRTSDLTIPIIVVSADVGQEVKTKILKHGADDCFSNELIPERLNYWIDFLKLFKKITKEEEKELAADMNYTISPWKRAFDILVSGVLLFMLSPLLLLIALIVKLESRGPAFYVSKRAGAGYKVFNFYKFRSMAQGSDQELSKLLHLNQYGKKVDVMDDNGSNPVFFKIKDDPRITRFGKFLRDSSLDELPQLINVLKGDMSIVGNRPLPLYEAQQLTKDQYALRFMAAAGITGLWQVTKRGKSEMSEEERITLDVEYAKNNSFIKDIRLLFKTFPALLQEERV